MNNQYRGRRWTGRFVLALSLSVGLGWPLAGAGLIPSAQSSSLAGRPAAEAAGPAGLISDAVDCLAINTGPGASSSGTVQLSWSGAAEGARVVLDVSGTNAAQPVSVNGQLVGSVPADTQGAPCELGQAVYLDFGASVLRQGTNQVEIGDAGQPGNAWTAAHVRLEVLGPVQPAQIQGPSGPQSPAVVNQVISFISHYDSTSQQAAVQLPDGYSTANPVPLVIYAHSRYATMEEGIDELGAAANSRGWLLASPQLHGRWPITLSPPGKFAYASVESQYDMLGTVQYLLNHPGSYNVDRSRIYVVGYSMGGQLAPLVAAKYPDVFAAIFDNKGPSDFEEWYNEQNALPNHSDQVQGMKQECYTGSKNSPSPQPPSGNLFCYHRRSSVNMASNLLHVPISITHSSADQEVPIVHSYNLRDAINSFGPDRTATVYVDTTFNTSNCPPYVHCYVPDPNDVMGFFQPFTLQATQNHINIVSDESKSYYWLNIDQNNGDHWSYVEATANLALHTVTLVVTDHNSLSLGLNLGASPIQDWAGLSHPGLGLPAGTYHVQGASLNTNMSYSSGYLTLALPVTNQAVITITPTSFTVHNLFLPAILK